MSRPLPLASHWNVQPGRGFAPDYQLELLTWHGRRLQPALMLDRPGTLQLDYYEPLIRYAAAHGLPLSFPSRQWEQELLELPYRDLPLEVNPMVSTATRQLSPVGSMQLWYKIGRWWTDTPVLQQIQALYPNPPSVVFISNNEAPRGPRSADIRVGAAYDEGGFRQRYRVLLQGMRDGLTAWSRKALFIGYGVDPAPAYLGRWWGWKANREANHLGVGFLDNSMGPGVWDGGSFSYYTDHTQAMTDYTVWSPQTEAMNWAAYMARSPYAWTELSLWNGDHSDPTLSKIQKYLALGQTYTPERYAGVVQFGLWLIRPRVAREFQLYEQPRSQDADYFAAVCDAVARARGKTLSPFWSSGALVPNPAPHPYGASLDASIPPRNFRLDTNLDPPFVALETAIPVFALALMLGTAPARLWLLYAHAPLSAQTAVQITIPGYRSVVIDVAVGGSFYIVREQTGMVMAA